MIKPREQQYSVVKRNTDSRDSQKNGWPEIPFRSWVLLSLWPAECWKVWQLINKKLFPGPFRFVQKQALHHSLNAVAVPLL